MAGGSREPETEDDQQCQHCGLWWASGGVVSHEQNCDWKGFDRRLQGLVCEHALLRAGEVDPSEPASATIVEEPADEDLGAPIEVEGASGADPGADPGGDPTEGRVDDGMRADGAGPMEIPEFGSSDEEAESAAESETRCPGCDRPASADPVQTPREALPDEVLERHGELKRVDHICRPCSTDEDGNWTSPVEVFNSA